jgi:UDP-N-acetylglucosamine--N-acetylmuramyl-(pentapeptide) pyrophosphoryl-undecaprenol N-acetylglucosamine transferase
MISGGGTGGHIFPAISIANELKRTFPDAEFLFVGAQNKMEMERVPQAGYRIEGIWISGIQRKLTAANLAFPFKVVSSLSKCFKLIRKFKPDVVIGTGGFASGPLLYAASLKGKPTLIQEQNSYPGITNKILAAKAAKICVAYSKMDRFFPKDKIVFTGNPIRKNITDNNTDKTQALEQFKLHTSRPTLLILGGSLGARKINELIASNLDKLLQLGVNILWQTGKLYYDSLFEQHREKCGDQLQIHAFLKDMNAAYAASDIIISRSGAGTISELAVSGKATLLIPSPNVAEDHQTKNAMALVENDAALIFKENEDESHFLGQIQLLLKAEEREKLQTQILKLAKPNAAADIAQEVIKLMNHAG